MQKYHLVYSSKVNHVLIHKKSVQLQEHFLGAPTWPPSHSLETNMAADRTLCEKRSVHAVLIYFMRISLPAHLGSEQASIDIFMPMQFCPPHFGAGSVHVRTRDLFPVSHVTLHGCHGNHWLHSPSTINQLSKEILRNFFN